MLRTAKLLHSASDPAFRPNPGASLPGTLASPRTGLAPAGRRELVARLRHECSFAVMASPNCWTHGTFVGPRAQSSRRPSVARNRVPSCSPCSRCDADQSLLSSLAHASALSSRDGGYNRRAGNHLSRLETCAPSDPCPATKGFSRRSSGIHAPTGFGPRSCFHQGRLVRGELSRQCNPTLSSNGKYKEETNGPTRREAYRLLGFE